MPKNINEYVSDNQSNLEKIDSTFIPVSTQKNQNLKFSNNIIRVNINIEVYTRSLNDNLISGHPDGKTHGSGYGVHGDVRGNWSLETDKEQSDYFVIEGRNLLSDALSGSTTSFIRETAIGDDSTIASPEDTSLKSKNGKAFAWGDKGIENNESIAESIFLFSEYGDKISEYGVYSQGGKLYNRVTTETIDPTKSQEVRVKTTFTVEGNGEGISKFTDNGEQAIARTLRDADTVIGFQEIAFGSGSTNPQETDTTLDNELFRKGSERKQSNQSVTGLTVVFQREPSNQPVTIEEIGLFDNGGNLLWRSVFVPFEKNENIQIKAEIRFPIR